MRLLQALPFRAILEKKERGRPAAVTNMRVRHEKIFATLVHLTTNCWYEEGNDYHGKPSWIWANPGSRELRLDREMLLSYMQELRDSNKAEGQDRIYTHGEKEFESKQNVVNCGVSVNAKTYAEMQMIAEFTKAISYLPAWRE